MANRPIPVSQAEAMMQEYVSYMQGLGAGDQTQYISFTAKELYEWLTSVMPYMDELRVCEGLTLDNEEKPGKITAILWPYKNGKPATGTRTDGQQDEDPPPDNPLKPYNDGTGGP